MNANEHYLVGLDIGTTKICAIVARQNEYGKIEVLGMGKADSFGVMRGVVANIDKTVMAINDAVQNAGQASGLPIKEVYVGIAGQHIKSMQHNGKLYRGEEALEQEISQADVDRLINEIQKLALPPGDRIIHILPQEFTVDREVGIKDPIGMSGHVLEANFHIITGQITAARNINKCVEKSGLKVRDLILEPLASADAVLSEEEKEAGVALVDIGGGTTDIAIFQEGIIRHTAVIPFGGNIVTEDIKTACMIMRNQAEALKIKFGSALPTEIQANRMITIPGLKGRPAKEISTRNLACIIEARMKEILDHVHFEIINSGYERKLIGGIVLTGGGSQLNHLVQLTEYHTGLDTRLGLPTEHLASHAHSEDLMHIGNPMYATAIGLVLKGFQSAQRRASSPEPVLSTATGVSSKTSLADKLRYIWERSFSWWIDEEDNNDEFQ
jgi:cell division protein FtsA